MKTLWPIVAVVFLVSSVGMTAQEIVEFPIGPSWNGVAGLALGPDGEIWFTENEFLYPRHSFISVAGPVAQITASGVITEHHCSSWEGVAFSTTGGLATIPDGNVWTLQDGPGAEGQINLLVPCLPGVPGTTAVLPAAATSLITGPDGNLWFAIPLTFPATIGRSTTSGVLTTYSLPPLMTPTDLAAGPDGNVWFTDYGNGKVGRITPNGAITLFDVPGGQPSAISAGPDGNLWFIEANNRIARMTTQGSAVDYPVPTPASGLFDIAAGADGAMWFTESVGKIGRITTAGAVSEIPVPYANSSPGLIVGKPDGTIWFTDRRGSSGSDRIGRLSPTGSCAADPATLCLHMGSFSVTASFQRNSDDPFNTAEPVLLTANTGYFWFFDPANVEMTVKVLDGCSVNGHYWVFAGGMTNLGVQWTVRNSQSGLTTSYSNAVGTPFQPVQDTTAFSCP